MQAQVGLLPKSNHQQVPFAYKMYSRNDETGWRQSSAFKKAFSIEVDIDLIGVWWGILLTYYFLITDVLTNQGYGWLCRRDTETTSLYDF